MTRILNSRREYDVKMLHIRSNGETSKETERRGKSGRRDL